ncbi:polysaccharide deacetylase family protein [Paenibacillus hamazuiensis]|uniref:polysaccharide deacetylase family protein n=1 Tax=Paenibacillus hamazuiensis TaxID=2936508 RepID=UPI002010C598|nr:polysaccharide deacetylase family protein [Paenibacillus hamazuiensis]
MNHILILIVCGLLVYTIIPTFVIRLFGFGVYRQGTAGRSIALTFDDGPDPEYTPRLLDLLGEHQIKATFFVLGSKAEQHPELIVRMHEEGHLVGVHNYVHWANALMTPKRVRRQIEHSVSVIERIVGIRPVHYRPPWGIINIFDFLLMKRFRMIMWSIIVGDWRSRGGKRKIKMRLLSKLRPGAVIVLHDSGRTFGADLDAPVYMLEALHEFIGEAQAKGYNFERIDEKISQDERSGHAKIGLTKRLFASLWFKWDELFHLLFRIKQVDPENPFLFYRTVTYRGKPIPLADGETLASGDRVIELHFNNKVLLAIAAETRSTMQLAVKLIRTVKEALPQITANLLKDAAEGPVKAVYGITMIHRGAEQLGFTITDLPRGWFLFASRIYLRALLYAIHPDGKARLQARPELLTPKILAISTKKLISAFPAPTPVAELLAEDPAVTSAVSFESQFISNH